MSKLRSRHLVFICLSMLLISAQAFANQAIKPFKIIVGSCSHQDKPQPIWQAIGQEQADLLMLLGDNVYGDTEDMQVLKAKYAKQWSKPGMQQVLANTPLIGIWDDHDYGKNDGGAEYPQKEASRQIMLDYFKEPKDSPRRTRPDGIYTSYIYGKAPHRIQVIMPDLRWNRAKLNSLGKVEYMLSKKIKNMGPYEPHSDTSKVMLGEKQWRWLEQQLQQPAEVRIFASSLQVLPEFTGWESWANFPHERQRLLDLLAKYQINNLIMLSGDTHWSEFSRVDNQSSPLWEMTSSGLTEKWPEVSPNKHRVGESYAAANYGVIKVEWLNSPVLSMTIKDVNGDVKLQQHIEL